MSVGLAITRIVLGLYLTGHGLQKASPRLGFGGISGTAEDFARAGMRGGRVPAVLTAVLQLGAGILLAIGLLTALAAMAAAGVMIVAVQTRLRAGFWSQRGGYGEMTGTVGIPQSGRDQLETASLPSLILRIKALSWGMTSGSESSARSSWLISCGVSLKSRSSASTARARSIAAPKTNDVRSCSCRTAAALIASRDSGFSRRLMRADLASDMTYTPFSRTRTSLYVSETYRSTRKSFKGSQQVFHWHEEMRSCAQPYRTGHTWLTR